MKVFRRNMLEVIRGVLASAFLTVAVAGMVLYGLNQAEQASRDECLRILDESVRRAVATCYAIEGHYPENVSYIEKNYGVYIDKSKYAVHYEVFADNIMPEITIVEKV